MSIGISQLIALLGFYALGYFTKSLTDHKKD